ncbi:TPA: hypothetical protein ACP2SZ_004403 [Escherichia coli]
MITAAAQAPSNFHSHLSLIRTFFIVSLLVLITATGVVAVRVLAMFWHVYACQKRLFPKITWLLENPNGVLRRMKR